MSLDGITFESIIYSDGGGMILIADGERCWCLTETEAVDVAMMLLQHVRKIVSPRIIIGDIFVEDGDTE